MGRAAIRLWKSIDWFTHLRIPNNSDEKLIAFNNFQPYYNLILCLKPKLGAIWKTRLPLINIYSHLVWVLLLERPLIISQGLPEIKITQPQLKQIIVTCFLVVSPPKKWVKTKSLYSHQWGATQLPIKFLSPPICSI